MSRSEYSELSLVGISFGLALIVAAIAYQYGLRVGRTRGYSTCLGERDDDQPKAPRVSVTIPPTEKRAR